MNFDPLPAKTANTWKFTIFWNIWITPDLILDGHNLKYVQHTIYIPYFDQNKGLMKSAKRTKNLNLDPFIQNWLSPYSRSRSKFYVNILLSDESIFVPNHPLRHVSNWLQTLQKKNIFNQFKTMNETNLKFRSTWMSRIFDSIIMRLCPRHCLGPKPKGWKVTLSILPLFSALNLSGSNVSGSGQMAGS